MRDMFFKETSKNIYFIFTGCSILVVACGLFTLWSTDLVAPWHMGSRFPGPVTEPHVPALEGGLLNH